MAPATAACPETFSLPMSVTPSAERRPADSALTKSHLTTQYSAIFHQRWAADINTQEAKLSSITVLLRRYIEGILQACTKVICILTNQVKVDKRLKQVRFYPLVRHINQNLFFKTSVTSLPRNDNRKGQNNHKFHRYIRLECIIIRR